MSAKIDKKWKKGQRTSGKMENVGELWTDITKSYNVEFGIEKNYNVVFGSKNFKHGLMFHVKHWIKHFVVSGESDS